MLDQLLGKIHAVVKTGQAVSNGKSLQLLAPRPQTLDHVVEDSGEVTQFSPGVGGNRHRQVTLRYSGGPFGQSVQWPRDRYAENVCDEADPDK